MSTYELVNIITNILYIFAINKMFNFLFFDSECKVKFKRLIFVLYYVLMSIISLFNVVPLVNLFINIFLFFMLSLCYKVPVQRKIIGVILVYSVGLVIEIISLATLGFFEFSGFKNTEFNSISALIFTRVVTVVVVYLITRHKLLFSGNNTIPKIYYLMFSIVLFGSLYLFLSQLENNNLTISKILISGTVLIVVNLTMIIIDERIYKLILMENEKNMLIQQNSAYENQMNIINQSTEDFRLIKHDFKNHLIMMSSLNKSRKIDEFDAYISHILGNIEDDIISETNNFVIDSIINFKLRNIKNMGIDLTIDINIPETINILAYDLTCVLSNLLDNAISACKDSQDKKLDIKISYKMKNLIILISNSYNGKIICENGKLKTTKKSKLNHGLGLKSVEKILESYGGEMGINYDENTFLISVIIPYMKQTS